METLLSFVSQHPEWIPVADSRQVNEHSIFFAIAGTQSDGHAYIPEVIKKGVAALVLQEEPSSLSSATASLGKPRLKKENFTASAEQLPRASSIAAKSALKNFTGDVFYVPNSRKAWAEVWRHRSGCPDEKLFLVGITGTNGKTSMAHMAEHILNIAGDTCAVMGTINHHLQDKVWPTAMTTPGADILFPRLKEFLAEGAKACALEISSHGLDQNRAENLNLNAAIFSNLTNDHLDYHKGLEDYFLAKEKLFTRLLTPSQKKKKIAVINLMDDWAKKIILSKKYKTMYLYEKDSDTVSHQHRMDFIAEQRKKYPVYTCEIEIIKSDQHGSQICLHVEEKNDKGELEKTKIGMNLPVVGRFQAYNWAQVALSVRDHIGNDAVLQRAAQTFSGIPGRLQKVILDQSFKNVFVDYAHTPDALMRSLESLRQITKGQIVVVFGCGGDRDKAKRPLMAQVAERGADQIIVTNDNPRTENPEDIVQDILSGFDPEREALPWILMDRKQAIAKGLELLKSADDVLLIAGKGHENYQIVGEQKNHFSDYETAYELLQKGEA